MRTQGDSRRHATVLRTLVLGLGVTFSLAASSAKAASAPQASSKGEKIFAQELVEQVLAKHSEITGLEIASTPPNKGCMTIAATEAKEIGEKCDKDELTVLKTHKPFVEKEKDGYDVSVPLHDASGKLVGTAGMDFKLGQEESKVVEQAQQIASEMGKQIPSKSKLFEKEYVVR